MNSRRGGGGADFAQLTDATLRHAMDMDCSISMAPGELQRYLDLNSTAAGALPASPTMQMHQHQLGRQHRAGGGAASNSLLFGSVDSLANVSTTLALTTATAAAAAAGASGGRQQRTDALFAHFLEVVQARTNDSEVFDTVRDLIQVCTDTLSELSTGGGHESAGGRALASVAARDRADCEWLTKERDTWRLLYALYKDRLCVQAEGGGGGGDLEELPPMLLRSEKDIVERLYVQNGNLREYQLIVDWLEQSAAEQAALGGFGSGSRAAQIGCFTDRTVGWENTLMQLKNADQSMFGGGGGRDDVVRSMDPDAPLRESRRLHDLDEEDDGRLAVQILREIRMGRIEEAQSLCEHCGQPWQAAVLEGWRLHHDGNYERDGVGEGEQTRKLAIEGNPRRDLWKLLAWRTADHAGLDATTRAIAGILCGHLAAVVASPLSHSWPDLLWAYLKVQIDLRVEDEIRSCSARAHLDMPAAYWAGKMTLEQIFGELIAHDNAAVSAAARHPMHTIQRYLALDAVPEMLATIDGWLIAGVAGDAQRLRFLAHLVLFMRQVGRMSGGEMDIADRVIRAYVECLIRSGADAQLVAFYAAAVPAEMQLVLYARFLRTLTETSARRAALEEAQLVGLDVCAIASYTVDAVRLGSGGGGVGEEGTASGDEDAEDTCPAAQQPRELAGTVSAADGRRISALEWLTFYAEQKGDLLWQACAMIRTFLGESRVECVRRAFEMVPVDTVGRLLEEHGGTDNLPYREECSVKEYLCYQAYLGALDGYNEWTRSFHARPQEPRVAAASAAFTERIAAEHREQAYRAELQRWRVALAEQTRVTRDAMFAVLRFPEGGFLVDPEPVTVTSGGTDASRVQSSAGWSERLVQLASLRTLCVPETVLLLHRVLHEAGEYRQCVRLADELASEGQKLYAVYTKQRLAEIIAKIGESSLALMNDKLDPFGYAA